MSLSTFHLVFVAAATAVTVGFACWSLAEWARAGSTLDLVMAVAALAGAVVLARYASWFRGVRRDPSRR